MAQKIKHLTFIGQMDSVSAQLQIGWADFLEDKPNLKLAVLRAASFQTWEKPRFKLEVWYNFQKGVTTSKLTWLKSPSQFKKDKTLSSLIYKGGMPDIWHETYDKGFEVVFTPFIAKSLGEKGLDLTRKGELFEDLFETISF